MSWKNSILVVLSVFVAAGIVLGASLKSSDDQMGAPTPGPEHAILKKYEGAWDATNEMMGQTSKATYTCKVICGGFWLASEYKGDFMGSTFTGHEQLGFDTTKKKYVSTWIDSMSSGMMMMEGTFDAATKSMSMAGDAPDMMTGKMVRHTTKTTWIDDNNYVFTMSAPGPDGKDAQLMKITYKRRAAK